MDKLTPGELESSVAAGRARAAEHEQPIADATYAALVAAGELAADRFATYAQSLTSAADWAAPTPDEVYPLAELSGRLRDATDPQRTAALEAMMAGTLAQVGLSFDVTNPLIEGVFEQLGGKIVDVSESHREAIMQTIARGWEDGLGIDEIRVMLVADAKPMAAVRAARIARTEIGTAANGGAVALARLTSTAAYKQWLATDDSRTRPDHADSNGQTVRLADHFSVGGWPMDHPGDQNAPAGEVVNCRCTVLFPEKPSGYGLAYD